MQHIVVQPHSTALILLGAVSAALLVAIAAVRGRPRTREPQSPPRQYRPLASVLTAIKEDGSSLVDVNSSGSSRSREDSTLSFEAVQVARRRAWVLEAAEKPVPVPLR